MIASLLFLLTAAASERVEVAPVWAGHPVGFALLTHRNRQFVAYYDADRRMTVAARDLPVGDWHRVVLPENLGWDSHNYVTLAVDDAGLLHLSGNMHCAPLVYFRTRNPLDIDSFERATMTGRREDRVTYPSFLRGPANELIFTYRDGGSGNGDQLYNVYDTASRTWRPLLDTPLTAGEGLMNAYLNGPDRGPDGRFHLCWVWRDHSGCESNHDPCYARSADLVHWETAAGKPLTLPVTLAAADVVDPVPAEGGILNGNVKLGFDSRGRPIVSYHKFDAAGKTQVYNTRFQDGAWVLHQASDWDYRWDFRGGGAIPVEIRISGVRPAADRRLRQTYTHAKYGSGAWLLDDDTLEVIERERESDDPPAALVPDPSGMIRQRSGDLGAGNDPAVRYELEWHTLPANRDRPREGEPPPPTMLYVVRTGTP